MTRELVWVYVPFFVMIAGVIIYELRTELILDLVTLPALLYMLVARIVIGPGAWYEYLVAAVAEVLVLVFLGIVLPRKLGKGELIGMGAVKLMAVMAVALGLFRASIATGLFVVSVAIFIVIVRFVRKITTGPSSPFVALAAVIALILVPDSA